MGLFSLVKGVGEKLWDTVTGNHGTAGLAKRVQEHLNKTDIPDADRVDVQTNEGKATVSDDGLSQETKEKVLIAVGNISGIVSVDGQIRTSALTSESQFYTVKSGDTLSATAKQVYGNISLYSQIFEANKPMLKSPDRICPGQVLRIPEQ